MIPRSLYYAAATVALLTLFASCSHRDDGLPRSTRKLLDTLGWSFENLKASDPSNLSEPHSHRRYYLVEGSAETIWNQYIDADPALQWKGPMASFAGMYDPGLSRFFTATDAPIPGLSEGQIFFLDLNIEYMMRVPTAFMITDIDIRERAFVFSYLETNPARGFQSVIFHEALPGSDYGTIISHSSVFDNDSELRNRLYPTYHEQAIDEFHRNIARANGFRIKAISEKKAKRKGLIPEDQTL